MRAFAALLLALLLVPTASAQEGDPLCIIFFEPSLDFRLVDVKADLILTPDQRVNISADVDADSDGFITAEEVATYENGTVFVVTEQEQYRERLLYMDGNLPTRMTVYTKLRNWTGPVEEARKGVVTELREYHTVPADDVGHLLTGGLYAPAGDSLNRRRPVIETIVINAPDGWVVYEVRHTPDTGDNSTSPYPTYSSVGQRYEQKSVQISSFDIRRQYEVVFAKEGENPYAVRGSPGPSSFLLLAAIVALALVVRRR